jgi:hypothetical protein
LLRLARYAPALPSASIENCCGLTQRGNLVDLLIDVRSEKEPVLGNFLVRDDEDLSTPWLARRIGRRFNRIPLLLSGLIAAPPNWERTR